MKLLFLISLFGLISCASQEDINKVNVIKSTFEQKLQIKPQISSCVYTKFLVADSNCIGVTDLGYLCRYYCNTNNCTLYLDL